MNPHSLSCRGSKRMCAATRTAFRLLAASRLPFAYFDATLDDLVRSRAASSLPRGAPLLSRHSLRHAEPAGGDTPPAAPPNTPPLGAPGGELRALELPILCVRGVAVAGRWELEQMEGGDAALAEQLRAWVAGQPAGGEAASAAPGEAAGAEGGESQVGAGAGGRSLNDDLRAGESGEDPAEHFWRRGAGGGRGGGEWVALGVERLTGHAAHNKHVVHLRLAPSPPPGQDDVPAGGGERGASPGEAQEGGAGSGGAAGGGAAAGYSPGDVALLAPRNRPAATQVCSAKP